MIALPFMMVLPLTAGLLSLVARSSKRALFAVLAAVGCSMGASSLFILRETWGGEVLTHSIGNWPVGLGLGLASDAMGSIVMLIVLSIGLLSLVFSIGEAEGKDLSKLHSAVYFLMAGLNGVALATDLFNLFVFMELGAISTCVLVAFLGGPEEIEASVKYVILSTLSSLFFLVGIVLIYDQVGSLNLGAIGLFFGHHGTEPPLEFAMLLVLLGIGMASAIFPLHTWVPDAHSRAPTAVSALLSGASVQVGLFAMIRILHQSVGLGSFRAAALLPWLGLATALFGSMLALSQTDIKRLLAYTTISSSGFSVVLLSMQSAVGFQSLVLNIMNHATAKALLFMSAGCLAQSLSQREFAKMRGAWSLMPGMCIAFIVGSVADIGGPSLGFLSKVYLFLGLVEGDPIGVVVLALSILMTGAAYLRVIQTVVSSEPASSSPTALPASMKVATAILTFGCIALGAAGWAILGASKVVAAQMMDRLAVMSAMLGI